MAGALFLSGIICHYNPIEIEIEKKNQNLKISRLRKLNSLETHKRFN